jgi:hypothetical protein
VIVAASRELLSLERFLTCPACHRQASMGLPELYVGALSCKRCGAHWWANRLRAGSVRAQLLADYEGDEELVIHLMTLFGLPETIEEPRFWQILLSGQQWYRYHQDSAPGIRGRSIALLRGVVSILRRAS